MNIKGEYDNKIRTDLLVKFEEKGQTASEGLFIKKGTSKQEKPGGFESRCRKFL
jgi:hypothetical protein